jgi:hypothetical protein
MRSASINDLTINRLTTWSAIQIYLQFGIQSGNKVILDQNPPSYFVRLEIDNNTDAERDRPFDQGEVAAIYKELFDFALESAEKGEMP